ncbi:MAG: M3 family oligoendopeptidase [Candidatus Dormibacteria bacterium]
MTASLPTTAAAFSDASWTDLKPYYDELGARPLTPENAPEFLRDWSSLEELWGEAVSRASYNYTRDTTNADLERVNLRFSAEIEPLAQEQRALLAKRLVESGYEQARDAELLRRFRVDAEMFRAENVPLQADLERLSSDVQKLTGSFMVEWDGEQIPLPRLGPHLESADRETRERAFRLSMQPYIDHRDELAGFFDQQLELRQQVAKNSGFDNFRDYMHRAKYRDYAVEDCFAFDAAVEEVMVPAASRVWERRRQQMGLDTLRPWDTDCDPEGRAPLRPYDTPDQLISRCVNVFRQVDPVLGGYFQTMADEDFLDLESRAGKAPGGYCTSFPHSRRPAIFMNAASIAKDVVVTLHEAGHCFQAFEVFEHQDLLFQHWPGMEMAEVGSMAMELLAAPYLGREKGGFYDGDDHRRARIEHLEDIITFFPHYAAIDGFQQWVYTDPAGRDADARDAYWLDLRRRLEPAVDFEGLDQQRIARWYSQSHIFHVPFYYIEYGIAQLGALQVWRNARKDQAEAVAKYRRALALGASRSLADLYSAAGIRLAFDAPVMRESVEMIEEELETLYTA